MTQAAIQLESTPLRVLIVEDSEEDVELIVLELRRGGYDPEFRRVDTAEGLLRALDEEPWDLVLSDFSMPRFSVSEALALVQRQESDVPFVIVSATIGKTYSATADAADVHPTATADAANMHRTATTDAADMHPTAAAADAANMHPTATTAEPGGEGRGCNC